MPLDVLRSGVVHSQLLIHKGQTASAAAVLEAIDPIPDLLLRWSEGAEEALWNRIREYEEERAAVDLAAPLSVTYTLSTRDG
jgi:hypothetical protein